MHKNSIFLIGWMLLFGGCVSVNQIDHIQGKGLMINNNIYVDENFTKELFYEATRVTGVGAILPEIHLRLYSPTFPVEINQDGRMTIRFHYGRYTSNPDRIYVYFDDSINVFNDSIETEAFLYGVLAHEFLHYLYRIKYKEKEYSKFEHCQMIESRDLEKLTAYIKNRLKSRGNAMDYHLDITEKACHN